MRLFLVSLISILLMDGIVIAEEPSRQAKPVLVWTGSDSKQTKESFSRCGTQEDLQAVWVKHLGRHEKNYPPLCPEIDFTTYMVVVLFAGEGSSDVGLLIDSVSEEKDCLRLRYRPFTYQTFSTNLGPDSNTDVPKKEAPVKKMETCSYAFVILPRTPKKVVIELGVFPNGRLDEPLVWKVRAQLP